jgi:hypothetical protein
VPYTLFILLQSNVNTHLVRDFTFEYTKLQLTKSASAQSIYLNFSSMNANC